MHLHINPFPCDNLLSRARNKNKISNDKLESLGPEFPIYWSIFKIPPILQQSSLENKYNILSIIKLFYHYLNSVPLKKKISIY